MSETEVQRSNSCLSAFAFCRVLIAACLQQVWLLAELLTEEDVINNKNKKKTGFKHCDYLTSLSY